MIKSIADIDKIRRSKHADISIRLDKNARPTETGGRMHIMVCGGTGCTSSNSMKIIAGLEELIRINRMQDDVKVVKTGCFGLCAEGPIVVVYPEGTMYSKVTPKDIEEIAEKHVKDGQIV